MGISKWFIHHSLSSRLLTCSEKLLILLFFFELINFIPGPSSVPIAMLCMLPVLDVLGTRGSNFYEEYACLLSNTG